MRPERAATLRPATLKAVETVDADLLRAMLDASCDGVLALAAERDASGTVVDGRIIAANRRAAACLDRPLAELAGSSVRAAMPSLGEPAVWQRCAQVLQHRGRERFDLQCGLDGLDTWFHVTAVPLGDGLMLSLSDVTDLKYALFEMEALKEQAERAKDDLGTEVAARQMMEVELRRLAVTDGLTGVLNRRGFDEVVRSITASANRYAHALSVIAIDIDHFKRVNDIHGHAAGDAVLMAVAAMLMEELRKDTDSISRVGGEEFMLLLPHTPAAGAAILAERLRKRLLAMPIVLGETEVTVTASFGVRELPLDGDAERMLIEADDALYRAKQSGRNCVVTVGRLDESAALAVATRNGEAFQA